MATEDKQSLLKNLKIKIKNSEEGNSANSKNRYNISGSNELKEEEKDSSKVSGEEDKGIIQLNMISPEKDKKSNENTINSKILKEKSDEIENAQNNSLKSSEKEEEDVKNDKSEEEKNKENENDYSDEENEKSSFLESRHYNNLKGEENEEINDSKEDDINNCINRKDPFMTTGKFMQIRPHFNLFSKRIDTLREGIYDNTKKCLMYKSSLQQSENLMRERANSIVKDFVDKLYNLKEMFINSNKDVANITRECDRNIINLRNIQNKNKNEVKDCNFRINACERQIGYKLLGKPNYSFMKRVCNTTTNVK